MPKVQLHGSQGTRTLNVRDIPKEKPKTPDTLYPLTLQEVIKMMPRRWTNVDELVKVLGKAHGIKANHTMVVDALKYCELDKRGIGLQMEVRLRDKEEKKASEKHQKGCFAIARKLRPRLEREGIDEVTLWAWVKINYKVESRTELDAHQWAVLFAELKAAEENGQLLTYLIQRIKRKMENDK